MKKKLLILAILSMALFAISLKYFNKRYYIFFKYFTYEKQLNLIENEISNPVLAEFSFSNGEGRVINFPHFSVTLNNNSKLELNSDYFSEIPDTLPILITVKTNGQFLSPFSRNIPLEDVYKGRYDRVIKSLCLDFIKDRPRVYLRLNPEMEVPFRKYPWQQYDPSTYIRANQYFNRLCRKYASKAKLVWGPSGYPGTMEFYPGDEWVDAATVTLKSDSEVELDVYPLNYPITYDLFRRLHRLRFLAKPIFILGSNQVKADSVNTEVISKISKKVLSERDVVYSPENFNRSKQIFLSKTTRRNLEIGVYDPQNALVDEPAVTTEHLFADFENLFDGSFANKFDEVKARGHHVIVTFEPFRNPDGKTDLEVLQHIAEGRYDREIEHLFSIIRSTSHKVFLRFAHEMEIPITRYPWQSQDPIAYIRAFRYFMKFKDSLPPNVKKVWGPAGDRGSLEWYPGDDVVDYVSIAIYGLPDKNITDPNLQERFKAIYARKSWRMRFVDKPIFITEFGIKGPESFQLKWLLEAAEIIRNDQRIFGVNYFNMSDTPGAWGEIDAPDWRISSQSFKTFFRAVQK